MGYLDKVSPNLIGMVDLALVVRDVLLPAHSFVVAALCPPLAERLADSQHQIVDKMNQYGDSRPFVLNLSAKPCQNVHLSAEMRVHPPQQSAAESYCPNSFRANATYVSFDMSSTRSLCHRNVDSASLLFTCRISFCLGPPNR